LHPKSKPDALTGNFIEFSQAEFLPDENTALSGFGRTGVLYVPLFCSLGESCSLHVVLHGCRQSTEFVGDTFYKDIGVNEWADTNGIVVLYPQAAPVERALLDQEYPDLAKQNFFAANPAGCWNWWGYAHDDRFLLKDGVQINAIRRMIDRIMGVD